LTAELRALSFVAQRIEHAVVIADARGAVTWVNDAFVRMSGYALDDVIDRRRGDVAHGPETDIDVAAHIRTCIERGEGFATEVLSYRRDGSTYWAAVDACPVRDEAGALRHFVAIERDVSASRRREDRLRHDALHDAPTGLPNRVLFHDRMAHAARRATRESADGFAVIRVDLDGFKAVNDTFGHATGDALLAAVARLLEANVRPGDTVARIGGDEFALLLEHVTATADAARVADRVLEQLRSPIDAGGHPIDVRASLGIALSGGIGFVDALHGADAAMYRAKSPGTARYAVFDPLLDLGDADAARTSAPSPPERRAS